MYDLNTAIANFAVTCRNRLEDLDAEIAEVRGRWEDQRLRVEDVAEIMRNEARIEGSARDREGMTADLQREYGGRGVDSESYRRMAMMAPDARYGEKLQVLGEARARWSIQAAATARGLVAVTTSRGGQAMDANPIADDPTYACFRPMFQEAIAQGRTTRYTADDLLRVFDGNGTLDVQLHADRTFA